MIASSSSVNRIGLTVSRQPVDYIFSEAFENEPELIEQEVHALLEQLHGKSTLTPNQPYLYSHGLGDLPVLSRDEEQSSFRVMNFLKHQIAHLQSHAKRSSTSGSAGIVRKQDAVRLIRDHLIYSNLRLVISLVKKFVSPQLTFDELYSEGVVTLMQAVEKFDYRRGFRFSTYAYRSISRALYQHSVRLQQDQMVLVEDSECWAAQSNEEESGGSLTDQLWRNMRDQLTQLIHRLDRREQLIVRARYALSPRGKTKTFQTLADKLGISKERVRQLEQRAVAKLQAMAAEVELAG